MTNNTERSVGSPRSTKSASRGFMGKALTLQLAALGFPKDGHEAEPALIGEAPQHSVDRLQADLAWHLRACGRRVLARVCMALAEPYPRYAEFQALTPGGRPFEEGPLLLLPPDEAGEADGSLPVGAHGALQGLPGGAAAPQDVLAVQV